jgi:ribosomal protein L16/L10AE
MNRQKLFKSVLFHSNINSVNISNPEMDKRAVRFKKQSFLLCPSKSLLIDSNQLEACRKIISRVIRRQKPKTTFSCLIRVNTPYTSKAKNSRMGRGKGTFSKFVKMVYAYSPIFLLRNVSVFCAMSIINKIRHKLKHPLCSVSIKKQFIHSDVIFECSSIDSFFRLK